MYRIILICLISISMCACAQKEERKLYTIGFVQMTEDPLLDEARKGIVASLKEEGFVEGKNIHINYKTAMYRNNNLRI